MNVAATANWTAATLHPDHWQVQLPTNAVGELHRAVQNWRSGSPSDVDLPACRQLMRGLRRRLRSGAGVVRLDGIPAERYNAEENRFLAGLLSELLGPLVAQKQNGLRHYDVRDTGRRLAYGVRRSVTNLEQGFHTDGGWLRHPPEFVGLYCVRPAASGGLSRCLNLLRLHDALAERAPQLLARLYRPLFWDRQAEHPAEESKVSSYPLFARHGERLLARYYEDYNRNGYRLAGAELDAAAEDALGLLAELAADSDNWLEFRLATGQFQLLNNRLLAHSRTAFRDDGAQTRHLVRLWTRFEQPGLFDCCQPTAVLDATERRQPLAA